MPGRSAADRSQAADRWSLAVSVLLIGGLLLAAMALYWNAQVIPPKKTVPVPKTTAKTVPAKPAAPQPTGTAVAIRLPPPPAPARATVRFVPAAPKPPTAPPVQRKPVENKRIVEPLKRTADRRPVPVPAVKAPPKIDPLKPLKVPPTKPVARPVSKPPAPAPSTPESTVVDGRKNVRAGGVLLRLLEHGQGPIIEIAWPRRADRRRALYRQLTRCYRVRQAVMVGDRQLFTDTGAAGRDWPIDMDRYSGFIRSPQGETIAEETQAFAAIATHHGLVGGQPVRVFPRSVDAALLGGLGAVLGPLYRTARQIRATYRWDRSGLVLDSFTVDGRALSGAVSVPLPRRSVRGSGCD